MNTDEYISEQNRIAGEKAKAQVAALERFQSEVIAATVARDKAVEIASNAAVAALDKVNAQWDKARGEERAAAVRAANEAAGLGPDGSDKGAAGKSAVRKP